MFGEENSFININLVPEDSLPLMKSRLKNDILPISLDKIKEGGYLPISLSSEEVYRMEREYGLDTPLYIALAHELFGQGLDYHYNPEGKYSSILGDEDHATFIENLVREDFGIENRPHYTLYSKGNSFFDMLHNINDYGIGGSILITRPKENTKYPYLKKEQENK